MSEPNHQVQALGPAELEDLEQSLLKIKGFRRGYDLRSRIVQLGSKLRQLREQETGLSQRRAATLLGMEQPELSRIETGSGPQGPSYATLTRVIEGYAAYIRANRPGAEVHLAIDIVEGDRLRSYSLEDAEADATTQPAPPLTWKG